MLIELEKEKEEGKEERIIMAKERVMGERRETERMKRIRDW